MKFYLVIVSVGLFLAVVCHAAKLTVFGNGAAYFPAATNSIVADVSFEDGFALSLSAADSQLSLNPFDDNWAAVSNGTLFCEITTVSGASNTISVLFGDHGNPALTIAASDKVEVVPAGAFPAIRADAPCGATATNRVSLVLHVLRGQKRAWTETWTSTNGGERSGPKTARFDWPDSALYPEAWEEFSIWLAGPEAALLDLRLKWRPDGTMMIFR